MPHQPPTLWDLIREDFDAHERNAAAPGFHALVVHRLGVWHRSVRSRALRRPLGMAYRVLARATASLYGIELPCSARIGRRVVFEHQHGIVVHAATVIGDDCVIRQGVTLGPRGRRHRAEAPVLGAGVEVGAGAQILGHVHIGDGAQIGPNSLVLEDVPERSLAVGVPARLLIDTAEIRRQLRATAAHHHDEN